MLRIVSSWFVAGIEPGVRSAPILYYMIRHRWSTERIIAHCRKAGWQCQTLSEGSPDEAGDLESKAVPDE